MIYDVGVIGLGYVGLTLATVMAETGLNIIGIEKRQEIVDLTAKGIPHFQENGLETALKRVTLSGKLKAMNSFPKNDTCKNYIITVGTPRKLLNIEKLNSTGFKTKISLTEGLKKTYQAYCDNIK
jgi:UDP-N-acetyl-D-mannosaminuronate dehydrogenase